MTDLKYVIAGNLKRIRQLKGLTQEQLAERSGIDRIHLLRLESGRVDMRCGTMAVLAKALGVRLSALHRGFD